VSKLFDELQTVHSILAKHTILCGDAHRCFAVWDRDSTISLWEPDYLFTYRRFDVVVWDKKLNFVSALKIGQAELAKMNEGK